MNHDDLFHSIYYTPEKEASFSGIKSLHKVAKKSDNRITEDETRKWLQKELTYSLHYPIRKHFKRNKIIASAPFELVQMDLCDMTEYASSNNNYRYILTAVDVFSKIGFAETLKNKEAQTVCDAVKSFIIIHKPHMIQTDLGTEFKNKIVMKMLRDSGIHLYFAYNKEIKASVVERFNRTLKDKMHRYFTSKGTRRYTNVLQQLVSSYNHTNHRSIGMKPIEVLNANPEDVFTKLYGVRTVRDTIAFPGVREPLIDIGSSVRVRYITGIMEKGYLPGYSDQVYTISKHVKGYPRIMYQVKDHEGNILPRKLYREDLQKVPIDTRYRVERVLRKRQAPDGTTEVRVKWLNFPSTSNSWVKEREIGDVS